MLDFNKKSPRSHVHTSSANIVKRRTPVKLTKENILFLKQIGLMK